MCLPNLVLVDNLKVLVTMGSLGASNERELLLHMNGGKGERSYANNSLLQVLYLFLSILCNSFMCNINCFLFLLYIHLTFISILLQKKLMLKAKPILEETITMLYPGSISNCIKVVDLGCSVGPNTLLVTSNIIDIVDAICIRLNLEPPTFQFYLNDLFGNDFNTIFKSLPDFYSRLLQEKGHKFGSCFLNATPGSFHGRLFPNNSIQFFHSANSLHWLSQVK